MTIKRIVIIILALIIAGIVFFLAGKKATHAPASPGTIQNPATPTATINGQTFLLEIAKDAKTRERGLSYRESLDQDNGLLFLFDRADRYSFWMKDMHFSIDIIYINNDTVVHVFENVPPPTSTTQTLPTYTPDSAADKVLEINAGLSEKYGIKKGDKVEFKGTTSITGTTGF